MDVVDTALWALVRAMDLKCTVIFEQGEPYLLRFYLGHRAEPDMPSVYLHYFVSSDDPRFLHNHPWEESHSLILTGGYREEYFVGEGAKPGPALASTVWRPGDWVRIDKERFHRVELLGKGCWTLFVAGRRVDTWKFWEKKTRKFEVWTDRNDRMSDETFIFRCKAGDAKLREMLKATGR